VDQVIGAFFMIRRSLFERLDGFDERFFVYFEEVDLARRAAQSGWASLHVAEARAYHKGGGTSQAVRAKRLFYSLRSRLKYSAKHHGVAERALLGVVTWGLEPLARTVLLLLRGRGSELTELFQAYRWLWKDRTAAP
jgi:GT2 family glycosyltransferase